jgi:hypothetical protein
MQEPDSKDDPRSDPTWRNPPGPSNPDADSRRDLESRLSGDVYETLMSAPASANAMDSQDIPNRLPIYFRPRRPVLLAFSWVVTADDDGEGMCRIPSGP